MKIIYFAVHKDHYWKLFASKDYPAHVAKGLCQNISINRKIIHQLYTGGATCVG